MVALDEPTVDATAPNADASKNGRALAVKNQFGKLHTDAAGTLLFGECQGSGKNPYLCSCDFARPDQPTFRCTCPSRQFPCKHCLGLMYAYALKKPFTVADVPADLQAKRDKLLAKAEPPAAGPDAEPAKPKTVNKAALAKKVKAQLDGLAVLERLTHDLVRLGVGNMNAKLVADAETQAKQLGDSYLPGAQSALRQYTGLFRDDGGQVRDGGTIPDAVQAEALDQLTRLHALLKHGRAYLTARLTDPELAVPTDTAIAAWLGHAWKLDELRACGLVEPEVELLQLAFNSHDDPARQEYIDTGIWMTLGTGTIRTTQTLRPYKAAKYIKGEDSFFQVACVKELCVYPGGVNPRVRWDAMAPRPATPADYATARKHGRADFAAAVKDVKNALKGALADRQPIVALNFARLGRVAGEYVIEDAAGVRLVLADAGMAEEPPSCDLLPLLPAGSFADQTLVVRFRHDLVTRQLRVKPLTLVTPTGMVRLTL